VKENKNICEGKKSGREERSLEGKKEVCKGRRKYGIEYMKEIWKRKKKSEREEGSLEGKKEV